MPMAQTFPTQRDFNGIIISQKLVASYYCIIQDKSLFPQCQYIESGK